MRPTLFSRIRRSAILAAIAPFLMIHRLAWWIDGWLYPSIERTEIRKPLFIVGVPRSGTTLAHRLVASQKSEFTTFPLWELLVAPALCQKRLIQLAGKLDALVGRPIARLIAWTQNRLARSISDVHPTTLDSPEEDYLGLMAFDGCFLKVLAFPFSEDVWDLVAVGAAQDRRRRIVQVYRGLLARHLAFHGVDKIVVSKNPSFTTWVGVLTEEFPDARFIALRRNLTESLPSQLSSMREGFGLFGYDVGDRRIVERFAGLYHAYWSELDLQSRVMPDERFRLIDYQQLRSDSLGVVSSTMDAFGYKSTDLERQELARLCEEGRGYVSKHCYDPADFGLTAEELQPKPSGSVASAGPDVSNETKDSRVTWGEPAGSGSLVTPS